MNYNPYQNKRNDSIDSNYIYPQPYIDPIMYMNPYAMNGEPSQNYNNTMEYSTYSNQYVDNPQSYSNMDYTPNDIYETYNEINNNIGIPSMPPSMMYPNNMMYPGMMMPPNMMYPGNMMYTGMIYPGGMPPHMNMMSNIPTVNMDEFDEEEM